ncbi:DUF6796 family protein [Peptoniphilus sp. BV3AC2]|uniref:DUF6796 family protein n=2 Tax=Peptoniphilus TaxID=162289 RepID=UPI0026A61886
MKASTKVGVFLCINSRIVQSKYIDFKFFKVYNKNEKIYHFKKKGAEFMTLYKTILIGLFGSFLMFLGDMILYYDKDGYDSKDKINSVITIMKKLSVKRLYLGGLLGPIGAFLYSLGFYHIVLASQGKYENLGWILFIINNLGTILGGAYHLQFAYLGLLSRHKGKESFDEFLKFLKFQAKFVFSVMALGNLGLSIMMLSGMMIFPRWQVLFTPLVLVILTPLLGKLPKRLHMIICGGWFNLIYFIYYLSLIISFS